MLASKVCFGFANRTRSIKHPVSLTVKKTKDHTKFEECRIPGRQPH